MAHHTRQWFPAILTVIAVAASIVLAVIGSGALGGTPISEAAGGALSADATPLAPAGPAFSIWSIIYLGLIAYAVWQLGAGARASQRQRALRPWAILSALLNAGWILTVQLGVLWLTVVMIAALLLVLIRIHLLLRTQRPDTVAEAVLADGTFGLYLGWVSVAMVANVTAWLAAELLAGFGPWRAAAIVLVLIAAAIGAVTAAVNAHRPLAALLPALSTAWGLAWIAIARLEGHFESAALVWTAGAGSAAVLITGITAAIYGFRTESILAGGEEQAAAEPAPSHGAGI